VVVEKQETMAKFDAVKLGAEGCEVSLSIYIDTKAESRQVWTLPHAFDEKQRNKKKTTVRELICSYRQGGVKVVCPS